MHTRTIQTRVVPKNWLDEIKSFNIQTSTLGKNEKIIAKYLIPIILQEKEKSLTSMLLRILIVHIIFKGDFLKNYKDLPSKLIDDGFSEIRKERGVHLTRKLHSLFIEFITYKDLHEKGYKITNSTREQGSCDLVMKKDNKIYNFEVKYKESGDIGKSRLYDYIDGYSLLKVNDFLRGKSFNINLKVNSINDNNLKSIFSEIDEFIKNKKNIYDGKKIQIFNSNESHKVNKGINEASKVLNKSIIKEPTNIDECINKLFFEKSGHLSKLIKKSKRLKANDNFTGCLIWSIPFHLTVNNEEIEESFKKTNLCFDLFVYISRPIEDRFDFFIPKKIIVKKTAMHVNRFQLTNIGRFSNLDIPLAPLTTKVKQNSNITVLIGNNGAGKTSLLKALATSLSWFVARLQRERGHGNPILESNIKNGATFAKIVTYAFDDHDYIEGSIPIYRHWTIVKTKKGRKTTQQSTLSTVTNIANKYREKLISKPNIGLPLMVFYPVERVVLDISLKIRGKNPFHQLDGYENSLNQGVDFKVFFEWFREREDIENESIKELLIRNTDKNKLSKLIDNARDPQLIAVRQAISTFMPDFTNLHIKRKPRLHIVIEKEGEILNVSQLSQGEKSLMVLVADIARRLAMMNPVLKDPLEGNGIILIDEIELHLHPKWQRTVIERLSTTFPNCQFVLTTHSPLVISDPKGILCYSLDNGELTVLNNLYGLDANQVLLEAMDTDIRNSKVDADFNTLI